MRQRVVRAHPSAAGKRARGWKAIPATPGLGLEAPRQLHAGAVAGRPSGAELHGHGQAAALARRDGDGDRLGGIVQQRRSRTRLAHLLDRASHVEVDQVGARVRRHRRRLAHDRGVVAEELDAYRVLVGMDAQELPDRALVAVGQAEARHHLGHHEPGPEALGLEADEPVADPGQGRQHDPVGEADPTKRPGIGELHGARVAAETPSNRRRSRSRSSRERCNMREVTRIGCQSAADSLRSRARSLSKAAGRRGTRGRRARRRGAAARPGSWRSPAGAGGGWSRSRRGCGGRWSLGCRRAG